MNPTVQSQPTDAAGIRVSRRGRDKTPGTNAVTPVRSLLGSRWLWESGALHFIGCLLICASGTLALANVDEAAARLDKLFRNPPVVSNLVYEEIRLQGDGQPESRRFFQGRWQSDGYVVRALSSLDQVAVTNIPPFGESTGSAGGDVWYYGSGTRVTVPGYPSPDFSLPGQGPAYVAASSLNNVLNWGINDLQPDTIKWETNGRFSGTTRRGGSVSGEILQARQALPTKLQVRYDGDVEPTLVDLEYNRSSTATMFPARIDYSRRGKSDQPQKMLGYVIHEYQTNGTPLPAMAFKLEAFHTVAHGIVSEITYSNGAPYRIENQRLTPVPMSVSATGIFWKKMAYGAIVLGLLLAMFFFRKRLKYSKPIN